MAYFPIYTTAGDWAALLVDAYLYNRQGEWIGWLDRTGNVYTVSGEYVGWLARDFRILRKRDVSDLPPRQKSPPRPDKMKMPASVALPPLMSELNYDTVDVLDEMPERLYTLDANPLAQDMD